MVSILNLKGPFTWCDSGCDKTATLVNIFSDIYTTHSEMKSLSQLHHVNTPLEINVTYYLHRPQLQSLSDRMSRPLGVVSTEQRFCNDDLFLPCVRHSVRQLLRLHEVYLHQ